MATIRGSNEAETLIGTAEADNIHARSGNDTVRALAGDDRLEGGRGYDRLFGGLGDDELIGEWGDDLLDGGPGNDLTYGGRGADRIFGDDGDDLLYGGLVPERVDFSLSDGVSDTISGGNGNDRIYGWDESADVIYGDAGNDTLGATNDRADGGEGDDRLAAYRGDATLTGGRGADHFNMSSKPNDGFDLVTVTDFSTEDSASIQAFGQTFAERFVGLSFFDRLDRNANGELGSGDGFQVSPTGTIIGVRVDADSLTVYVGGDQLDFLGVSAIARADWA